ncbi:hypothetical protein [Gilvimarinus sp. 1_MG-2023]|uniref:hypothetical protein n=1 Tax=Gilvimarinus sp. 1_MG-2023 TaxID=3062638 RepID=UPI0026E3E6EE|nr:hypothetical protein [Gilvimarinus sp. 1_MG-2023]MDO6747217.1 hypothetical protein [Gilvimarinus sp. 1_MG-2023]
MTVQTELDPDTSTQREVYTEEAVATDDGNGNLVRNGEVVGSVNYATGEITFDLRETYSYRVTERSELPDSPVWHGPVGSTSFYYSPWKTPASTLEEYTNDDIEVSYTLASDLTASDSNSVDVDTLQIGLLPVRSLPIIPGSVSFEFAGKQYIDKNGSIITDWNAATGAGTNVGSIDYGTATVTLNEWPEGADLTADIELLSCLTWMGMRPTNATIFRTAGSPLRQGSLIINATTAEHEEITAFADESGAITHAKIDYGYVDTETGTVWIEWAEPVFPDTVKYSAVAYKYLPLDPDLIGLDPTRLPSDGRVPVFLPGYVGVFSHTMETEIASPTAGATLDFTRDHQAEVWVKGANGETLDPTQYSLDRAAGELTWSDPLTLETAGGDSVTTPLTVFDRVEDMVLLTDVQVSGQVGFNAPLSQEYPAGEAILSSAVLHGDLRARVYNLFHQASWTGEWSDERIGDDTTAKYNNVAYPIEITNQGSIQERWHIRFISSTSFQVVGETVGVIGTGSTSSDVLIANPATGAPYFTIRQEGWGSGWSAGNVVRFNTDGAQAPFWVARTILSGPATENEDSFATQNRGDAD